MSADRLVENFFRHEYGRLVASLSRRVGVHHLEAVEDAVQAALMAALESWRTDGVPERPSAWLFRVAQNHLLGELRQRARRDGILARHPGDVAAPAPSECDPVRHGQEDLLRMLFVSCHDAIPAESQLVLALKVLCGFSVAEIAQRLMTTEANVYKRLERARTRLRELPLALDGPAPKDCPARRPAVHRTLYVLFTEGYLSVHPEHAIRRELCEEAIRLTTILAEHPAGRDPETAALLAMMHLHAARMPARRDGTGGLLLLAEQDRRLWGREEMLIGLSWLAEASRGDVFSRYHAEAGVAAEHCLAPSLAETRWDRIVEYYQLIEQVAPSPLHTLNRAIAVAEWQGPAAGLALLDGFAPPTWLTGSYQWAAVLADLHGRCGNAERARVYRTVAYEAAPTPAVRKLLERRLQVDHRRASTRAGSRRARS